MRQQRINSSNRFTIMQTTTMNAPKETQSHGMPWETEYGYAQGLKQDGTVWLSGQVGHDEQGQVADGMEAQMRQAYTNVQKLLVGFGLTMADVVDEVLYVLDNDAAFAARQKLGQEVYRDPMQVPSTMIGVAKLNEPDFLVEIKVTAKKPERTPTQLQKRIINPWQWQDERNYVQAVEVTQVTGTLYVSGQTAISAEGESSTADMRTQLIEAIQNLEQVVSEAGYDCKNIVRLNVLTTSSAELFACFDVFQAWTAKHGMQQATTLFEVKSLFETLTVELEATVVK